MNRRDSAAWMVTGVLGAMALGVVLIPLRNYTSASNLAFAFLAFTILVAEMGGRYPALVTAVVSAMSLNFFLTEPYLTLAISKPDDVVAFIALAACGLIAAAFGIRRERWSDAADRAGAELDVLKRLVALLGEGRPLDEALETLRVGFRLGAVALRDGADRVLAAAPSGAASTRIPVTHLAPDVLVPSGESRLRFGTRGMRLPEGGARLALSSGADAIWLDLWEGDAQGWTLDESRTLGIAASVLGLALSERGAGPNSAPRGEASSGRS